VGNRLRVNLSPDLSLASYVQYDTDTDSIGVNTRLRWTFSPVGDLFIVYNHNIRELLRDRWQLDSNHSWSSCSMRCGTEPQARRQTELWPRITRPFSTLGSTRSVISGAHGAGVARPRRVRHNETTCAGTERNTAKRSEVPSRKAAGNETDRSGPERVNLPLDHVIGVRIPASQPLIHTISII